MSAPAVAPILAVRGLKVAYGQVEALHHVDLTVAPGAIVTVIGSNGAGKTTLLAAIMGLLPSSGEIEFLGRAQTEPDVAARVAGGLTLVPEKRELFASLSVEDNLRLGAFARRGEGARVTATQMDEVFRRFPRLRERRQQLAGTLSGGERAMLALGRALMARPKLLMLDEPSLGLAPMIVREIFHIIADLRATGTAILLVEQNARAALQVADYGYVLETGDVLLEGPAAELADNPKIAESYLGIRRSA